MAIPIFLGKDPRLRGLKDLNLLLKIEYLRIEVAEADPDSATSLFSDYVD